MQNQKVIHSFATIMLTLPHYYVTSEAARSWWCPSIRNKKTVLFTDKWMDTNEIIMQAEICWVCTCVRASRQAATASLTGNTELNTIRNSFFILSSENVASTRCKHLWFQPSNPGGSFAPSGLHRVSVGSTWQIHRSLLTNENAYSLRRRASIPSGRKSLIVDTMQPCVTGKTDRQPTCLFYLVFRLIFQ